MPFITTPVMYRKSGPGPGWVKQLLGRLSKGLPDAIIADIRRVASGVSLAALSQAAGEQDMDAALSEASAGAVTAAIVARMTPTMNSALMEGGKLGALEARSGAVLDLGGARVQRWLDRHSTELIKNLGETERAALRAVLRDGWKSGKLPGQIAKEVQEIVGLNELQAKAVIARRAQLVESGASQPIADRRTKRYRDQLLRRRANTIAQTEVMTGLNEGRQQLWTQLKGAGALPESQQREWLTADDERVCVICGPADGKRAALDEPFVLSNGEHMAPPAHPRCRCTVVLVDEKE